MIDFEELPIEFDCDNTINKVRPSMIETKQENNCLHLQKGSLKEIDRLQFQNELMSSYNARRNSRPCVSNHQRLLNSSSSNLFAYTNSMKENNSLISVRKSSICVEKLTKLPNIHDLNGNNNDCTKTDTCKFQVENRYDEKFLVPNNLNQTKIQSENKQQGKIKRRRHSKKRSTSKPRSKSKRLYPSICMYQSQKIYTSETKTPIPFRPMSCGSKPKSKSNSNPIHPYLGERLITMEDILPPSKSGVNHE